MDEEKEKDKSEKKPEIRSLSTDILLELVEGCIAEVFFRNDVDSEYVRELRDIVLKRFLLVEDEKQRLDLILSLIKAPDFQRGTLRAVVNSLCSSNYANDVVVWLFLKASDEVIDRLSAKGFYAHKTIKDCCARLYSALGASGAERRRLTETRPSVTQKFTIENVDGYVTVGHYPEGKPGEIFLVVSKQGTVLRGLIDSLAIAVSIGLQYGIPLEVYVEKFAYTRFGPAGVTGNPDVPIATSILDFVFRWLGCRYVDGYAQRKVEEKDSALAELE